MHENSSSAPLGLAHFALIPTAYAVGFILVPLRGYCLASLLSRIVLWSLGTAPGVSGL